MAGFNLMPIQTVYVETIKPAVAGMTVNMELQNIVSRTVQTVAGTTNGLPFGVVVRRGTTDMSIQDASASTPILGVTVLDQTVRPWTVGADRYQQAAAVILKGVIWVFAGAAVTAAGAAAYFDVTGAITPTSTGNTLLPGAVFDSTVLTAGLVKLRLA